jgi:hypothetical protein
VTPVPDAVPNLTVAPVTKWVPVIVTEVPPAVGPAETLRPVTVGVASKVKWSAVPVAEVPPSVVTVIVTVPADIAGDVVVIWVADTTEKLTDAAAKWTALADARLVPVMVMDVPPAVGPADGLTPVTVGGA